MANESQRVEKVDADISGAETPDAAKAAATSFLSEFTSTTADRTSVQQATDALFKKADGPAATNPLLRPTGDIATDKTAGGLLPILALTRYEQLTSGKRLTPAELLATDSGPLGRNALDTKLLTYLRDNPGILNRVRNSSDGNLSSGAISAEVQTWIAQKKAVSDLALKSTPAYQMARDLYGERDTLRPGDPNRTLYDAAFSLTGRDKNGKEAFLYKADIDKAITNAATLGLTPAEVGRLQNISNNWEALKGAGIAPRRGGWVTAGDDTAVSRNSFAKAMGIPVETDLKKPSAGQILQAKIEADKRFTQFSGPPDGVPKPDQPVVRDYADNRRVTLNADGTKVTEYKPGYARPEMVGGKTTDYPPNYRDNNLAGTSVTVRKGDKPSEQITSTTYPSDYKGRADLRGATVSERTDSGNIIEKKTEYPPTTKMDDVFRANPALIAKFPDNLNARTATNVTMIERGGSQMIMASKPNGDKYFFGNYPNQSPFSAVTDAQGTVKQYSQNGETFRQDPSDPSKYKKFNGTMTVGDPVGFTNMKMSPDGTLTYADASGVKTQRLDGTANASVESSFKPITTDGKTNEKQYPQDRGFIRTQRDRNDQVNQVRIQDKDHRDLQVFQRQTNGTWTVTENNNTLRLTAAPDIKPDGTISYRSEDPQKRTMDVTVRSDGLRTVTGFDDGRGHTFKAEYEPTTGALKQLAIGNDVYTANPAGGFKSATGADISAIRINPSNGKIQLDQGAITREINPSLDYNARIVAAKHLDGGQVKLAYSDKGELSSIDYTNGSTTQKLTYNANTRTWKDQAGKVVGTPTVGDNGAINFSRDNTTVSWGGPIINTDVAALGRGKFESSARGPEKVTYPDGRVLTFGYSDATATSSSVLKDITRPRANGSGSDQLQLDQATKQWNRIGLNGEKIPISKPEWDKAGNITFKEGTMTKVWPENGSEPRITKMDYPGTNGWVDLKYGPSGALESAKVTGAAPARNTVELRGNLQLDSNTGILTHTDGGVTTQIKADGTKVVSRVEPGTGRTIDFNFSNVGGRSLEDASSVVVRGTNNVSEIYSRDGNSWKKDGAPPVKGRLKYENGKLNFTPDPSDTAVRVTPTVVDQSLTSPSGIRLEPPKAVAATTRAGGIQGSEYGSNGPWGVANNLLDKPRTGADQQLVNELTKILQTNNKNVDFMGLAGGTPLIHDGNKTDIITAVQELAKKYPNSKAMASLKRKLGIT